MGYKSMYGSAFVSNEDALEYALEKCGVAIMDDGAPDAEEFKAMLVEWFFSGNWVSVDDCEMRLEAGDEPSNLDDW